MKPYFRVTLWYLVFGVSWIVATDWVVHLFVKNAEILTHIQMLKGTLYVSISAIFIFALTRRAFRQEAAAERERYAVFRKTMEGSHHILLNYLNQMQLVTMEAERSSDFNPATVALAHRITDAATTELLKLGELDKITAEQIDAHVYRNIRPARPHS